MTQPAITDIGASLKAAREQKEITISSAAMQTNLSSQIIDKLENNQFSEIGAPVFTRGYLTQYARFLELDAAELTAAFNLLNPDKTELRVSPDNEAWQSRSFRRRRIIPWLITIPLLVLAGVIAMQVINPNSWLMTTIKQAFIEQAADMPGSNNTAAPEITLQVGEDTRASADAAPQTDTVPPPAVTVPSLTSLEDDSDAGAEQPENHLSDTDTLPELSMEQVDGTPVAEPAAENNTLTVNTENWVEVRNKDKKVIASNLYKAGDSIELPADGAPYDLTVGQPENTTLVLNGKTVPLTDFRVKKSARKFHIPMEQGQAQ